MYQNILQQLQQLFSGGGNSVGMQPGQGGISDMMYRYPPGSRPAFIDGLLRPPGNTGVVPPTIGGELPPLNGGGGVSTMPVPPMTGSPDFSNAQPMPMPTPPGGYNPNMPGRGNEGRFPGAPGTPSDMMYRYPPGTRPGSPGMPGMPGSGANSIGARPMPMPTPGQGPIGGRPLPGGERPGTYGVSPGNPRPMPMPAQRPAPMPSPGAATRPVTGIKTPFTGGY